MLCLEDKIPILYEPCHAWETTGLFSLAHGNVVTLLNDGMVNTYSQSVVPPIVHMGDRIVAPFKFFIIEQPDK